MQTKNDASYGIIPLRMVDGEWQALLINQYSHIGDNTYWVFPKGHAEGKETPLEAAFRELAEETGIVAEVVLEQPTFTLEYSFLFKDTKIEKTVTFFLSRVEGDPELALDPDEVREAGWFTLLEATERVDYKDTKAMVRKVIQFLENNPKPDWQ